MAGRARAGEGQGVDRASAHAALARVVRGNIIVRSFIGSLGSVIAMARRRWRDGQDVSGIDGAELRRLDAAAGRRSRGPARRASRRSTHTRPCLPVLVPARILVIVAGEAWPHLHDREHAAHLDRPNWPKPVIMGGVLSGGGISIEPISPMPFPPIGM